MKERTCNKMPSFSVSQREHIKGSFDFFGVNYYVKLWVSDVGSSNSSTFEGDFLQDLSVKLTGITTNDTFHLFDFRFYFFNFLLLFH